MGSLSIRRAGPVTVEDSGRLGLGVKTVKEIISKYPGLNYIGAYAWRDDQVWTIFYNPDGLPPELADPAAGYDEHVALIPHNYLGVRVHYDPIANYNSGRMMLLDSRAPFEFPGLFDRKKRVFAYSRYQHDFFYTSLGFALDGGAAYLRVVGHTNGAIHATFNPVTMKVTTDDGEEFDARLADKADRNLRGKTTWQGDSGKSIAREEVPPDRLRRLTSEDNG